MSNVEMIRKFFWGTFSLSIMWAFSGCTDSTVTVGQTQKISFIARGYSPGESGLHRQTISTVSPQTILEKSTNLRAMIAWFPGGYASGLDSGEITGLDTILLKMSSVDPAWPPVFRFDFDAQPDNKALFTTPADPNLRFGFATMLLINDTDNDNRFDIDVSGDSIPLYSARREAQRKDWIVGTATRHALLYCENELTAALIMEAARICTTTVQETRNCFDFIRGIGGGLNLLQGNDFQERLEWEYIWDEENGREDSVQVRLRYPSYITDTPLSSEIPVLITDNPIDVIEEYICRIGR